MSFVSAIMGTAERVPLPDVIIRAAIHRLCSRAATKLATFGLWQRDRAVDAALALVPARHRRPVRLRRWQRVGHQPLPAQGALARN